MCFRPTSWELKEALEAEPLDTSAITGFGDMIRAKQLDPTNAIYEEPCELIPSDDEVEQELYEDIAAVLLSPTHSNQNKPFSAAKIASKVNLRDTCTEEFTL